MRIKHRSIQEGTIGTPDLSEIHTELYKHLLMLTLEYLVLLKKSLTFDVIWFTTVLLNLLHQPSQLSLFIFKHVSRITNSWIYPFFVLPLTTIDLETYLSLIDALYHFEQ